MFIQTTDLGLFVLDPFLNLPDCGYDTKGGEIKIYVANKKHATKFAKDCFGDCLCEFEKKVGPYNQYSVELSGPIKQFNTVCVTEQFPPPFETVVFSLVCTTVELTNKRHRPELLTYWVLDGSDPAQFNKLLKRNFDVVEIENGLFKITKKSVNASGSSPSI